MDLEKICSACCFMLILSSSFLQILLDAQPVPESNPTTLYEQGELVPEQNSSFPPFEAASISESSRLGQETLLGTKIVLTCLVTGYPPPDINWYKRNLLVYAHNYFQIRTSQVDENLIRTQLIINPATEMDSGNYECQVENGHGIESHIFVI